MFLLFYTLNNIISKNSCIYYPGLNERIALKLIGNI